MLQHFGDLAGLQRDRDLVGIFHAEPDAVQVVQQVTLDAMAVDPRAVAAVEVLQDVLIVFLNNAGMAARSAVIAKNQVVVGLAADQEGKLIEVDAGALPRWVQDKESGAIAIRFREPVR